MPDTGTRRDVIRGGLDSLLWLVNNAHNHDDPRWREMEEAARADRDAALVELTEIEHALRTVRLITSRLDAWNVGRGEGYSGTVALAVQQLRKAVAPDA